MLYQYLKTRPEVMKVDPQEEDIHHEIAQPQTSDIPSFG